MRTPSPGRERWVVLALAMLLLITLSGDAQSQVSPASVSPVSVSPTNKGQDPELYKISLNVDLVLLNPTVRDRKGRLVSDLREQNFEVYEDGVRQTIRLFRHEDLPVTVGLVIDHSGSMRTKLPDVIAAAWRFVQTSHPEDRLFVVNFNEKVTLGLPEAMSFTNRSAELEGAILRTPATGMTALYDAAVEALHQLQAGGRDNKALIVFSDGGDNASKQSLAQLLKTAQQSSSVVYAIGTFDEEDPDRNPGVLTRLAAVTGGEAFFPSPLNQVVAVCERIARDIRNQYTIGYFSSNAAQTGAYRAIRVVARGTADGKLSVRARAGYIPGEPDPVQREISK